MLEQLKNVNANSASIDEMVSLRAYGRVLLTEYAEQEVEVPGWVAPQLKSLDRQILAKNHDRLESRRTELKARIDALKSPTQKKTDLEAELRKLNAKLNE